MSDNNSGGGYPPQNPQGDDYDPTRFGGPQQPPSYGGQQPPSYGGQQPPSYGGQQPPYGGDQPTTYGGPPQQGGYPPQQPPYGQGPANPPSYGTPMYGGGGYQPPGGPGYNAPPTGGGGRNNGLLIGLAALLVAAVIGAVALVVVLNRGDDDNSASDDDSSETSDPSDEPTDDEPTDEHTHEETDEPAEPSGDDVTPTADPIEVEYRFEIGNVCNGQPAKAADYDPSNPKVDAFRNSVAYPTSWGMAAGGYSEDWYVEYDDFKELSVAGCLTIDQDSSEKGARCTYEDSDGNEEDYDYYGATYELKFYEITTGKKIADGPTFEVDASECPEYGYPIDGKVEGYPEYDEVDAAINDFVADAS
ncbi:proline-rich domain-containing protein [Nocardioides speluncae]|uniref:proline-rich domain-containing protein n=1 Tax=Nocardioides speluncae TaxID=2670337 RepID=UPI000D69924A|nr:proline-rich domain-containing protein [Nocardioides speluncae]